MKRLVLSLFILVGLVSQGFAQDIPIPMPLNKQQKLFISTIMGPAMNSLFTKHRPGMLGLSFAMNPMFKAGFEKEFGFTEDQAALVMEKLKERFEGNEDMEAFGQIMGQIDQRSKENEDAESLELSEEEMLAIQQGYDRIFDEFSGIAPEVFTPEQMARINEMEFAVFGGIESPFVNVDAMGVLDLTAEQVRELEEFQQDIADEKLEMLDDLTNFTKKVISTGKLNMQEAQAFEAKNKGLANKVGARLREILTEEQLKKATKLIKDQQAKMAKMMGGFGTISQWMPSADSWAPGMPIPDSLKPKDQERRFPVARPRPTTENPPSENDN